MRAEILEAFWYCLFMLVSIPRSLDLVEHFGPVDGLVAGDELCRFLNCPSHDLKLFNAVFHQFFLKIQGIYHEMRIGLVDCHFHNIGQRKTERLESRICCRRAKSSSV